MPNWVKNNITFYGTADHIRKLRELCKSNESEFDFNNIVSMPDELNLVSGSDEDYSIEIAKARRNGEKSTKKYEETKWMRDRMSFDEWADLGEKYLHNQEVYGATTWYDWHCTHWGTKWNANDAEWIDDCHLTFNTAWSTPEPIFERLTQIFPDIEFCCDFADEDLGSNCGQVTYEKGCFDVEYIDDLKFACDVWDYDYEEIMKENCENYE